MPTPVPKVHPLTRLAEADDPMEVVASMAPGDPDYMLECMVDELSWGGMTEDDVLALFHDAGYPVLNQLLGYYGCDVIQSRVRTLFARRGGFRVTAIVDETPDPDSETEPELIQLTIRSAANRTFSSTDPQARSGHGNGL